MSKPTNLLILASILLLTTGLLSTGVSASAMSHYASDTSYSHYDDYTDEENEDYSDEEYTDHETEQQNIVTSLVDDTDYSTLVTAVTAAGLVDTVSNGDFTILAPSNTAFEALPAGTVETLVKPENKKLLTDILLYHVIPGKVDLHSMEDKSEITTVLGQKLTLVNEGYGLQVIDGKGDIFDLSDEPIEGTNGFIYDINNVLIPN
jgi:uncharacterized surface protein with fasciclin (FAS1) repeats